MKNYYSLIIMFLFSIISVNAQFIDNMESYTDGEPISAGHWTDAGCGGGEGCSLLSSSVFAAEGDLSGLIPGDETTEAVLDLGNKIFGLWLLEYWFYIPEGKESSMSLQGTVPVEDNNSIVGDILFNKDLVNPGVGVVSDSALGEVTFNFPHDEWFRVIMNIDISLGIAAATWQFNVNGIDILPPGTPYTNELGDTAASLGGILFTSVSPDTTMYLDNFCYFDSDFGNCSLNIDENEITNFKIFPNPSSNLINIESNDSIKSVKVYDVLGRLVLEERIPSNQIDVSSLSAGLLFVKIETDEGSLVKKVIKE